MNAKRLNGISARAMYCMIIAAMMFSMTGTVHAAGVRTFVGIWRAIDNLDGSLMRVTITGPARGPFLVTWTESYFGFCDGRAGIAVGKGWLDPADPYVLEADMRLKCLRTGDTTEWHQVWKYKPDYDVLASYGDYGVETIWTRLGRALVPRMDLRVNYGHEWVESFYKTGHTVLVTVTEADGVTEKATIEVQTEPKDYWGGEAGFQSMDGVWDPGTPDIQPGDWVFAQVDNGQTAKVQIGDISGMIDLDADSIGGTVNAPWFSDEVEVECHSWGAPLPEEILKYDAVLPDGEDLYSCSWAGEWDIQPGQDVGVAYFGPDSHWVANAFFVTYPTFVAYLPGAIEGYDWPLGDTITININDGEYIAQAVSEQRPDSPEGATRVLFETWRDDFFFKAGDHILMTDDTISLAKDVVVMNLAVTSFDLAAYTVTGVFDPDFGLWVWLYGEDGQVPAMDGDVWTATFAELPPGAWGGATQWEADGDGTSIDFQVPNPNLYAVPDENKIYANEWIAGFQLDLKIYDPDGNEIHSDSKMVETPSEVPWTMVVFDYDDLSPGQRVVLNQRGYVRELVVSSLMITGFDLANQQVLGTGDAGAQILIRINGEDIWGEVDSGGNWVISHPQLGPGVWGEAIQPDGIDGDETRDGFRAPNPDFYVTPEENEVFAAEWTPGQTLEVYVNGVLTASQTVPDDGSYYGPEVQFFLESDVEAGDTVTLTDGRWTKELIVANLQVTGFDLTSPITISGVADAGWMFIGVNGADMWIEVGAEGTWEASSLEYDSGEWGSLIITDEDGDQTRDIFMIPYP